jgi:hypothetical protein
VPGRVSRVQKDALGQEIRVGDILLSASKTGNVKVGRVEKIHDSGYITVKFAEKRNVYAYEEGAPKVPGKVYRQLKNEDGTPKMREGGMDYYTRKPRMIPEYGYVDEMVRDTTVLRKDWFWKQEEAAHYARFVVRSTADHPLFNLSQFLDMDYDAERPALP